MKDNSFTEFCCFLSNLNMNPPYVYIYPLPFEPPSHLLPHPTPLGWYRAPVWVPWDIQQIPIGCLFYICKFRCYSLHTSQPLLPSPHVHKSKEKNFLNKEKHLDNENLKIWQVSWRWSWNGPCSGNSALGTQVWMVLPGFSGPVSCHGACIMSWGSSVWWLGAQIWEPDEPEFEPELCHWLYRTSDKFPSLSGHQLIHL